MSPSHHPSNLSRSISAALSLAALLTVGCGREAKPAAAANAEVQAPPQPAPTESVAPEHHSSLEISESVRQKCNLPNEPREAPQFDYDEAALRPRGQGILDELARCLKAGGMTGQSIIVVGHADSRGSEDYNMALGEKRARAAADYLERQGVSPAQLSVVSRGEQDASGGNEREWQLDRNVQIAEKSP